MAESLIPERNLFMQHLLSMHALDKKQMIAFFDRADYFLKTAVAKQEVLNTLHGKVIVNLFFSMILTSSTAAPLKLIETD